MGDIRNANPEQLEELADKLRTAGDGGAYGDLTSYLDRARNLDASGELASLRPLLEWLYDAAEQLREGARILRGDDPGYHEPMPGYVAPEDDSGSDIEWDFKVSDQFLADEFLDIASKDELSEEDISRLQGLVDHSDENPDFAAYIIDNMGMDEFLHLSQQVEEMDDSEDTDRLLTSMGNMLSAAMWVPGDMQPGSVAYDEWTTTPQGQAYLDRLEAFNNAGKRQVGSDDGEVGFGIVVDLLERSQVPIDEQLFQQTMDELNAGVQTGSWDQDLPDRLMILTAEGNPQAIDGYFHFRNDQDRIVWAADLMGKGEEMTDVEVAALAAVLEANQHNEDFAVGLATEVGAENLLQTWAELIVPVDTGEIDSVSDARESALIHMQESLGNLLGLATRSSDPRMDQWERDIIAKGDQDVGDPSKMAWEPYGYLIMSNLMQTGEYDNEFLTTYGNALISWEQDAGGPGQIAYRVFYRDPPTLVGDSFWNDPVAGYAEALGHNPDASASMFSDPGNFRYLVEERDWGTISESGYTALGHALESATSGHAYDDAHSGIPHSMQNADIAARVIDFYGDNPDKMENGELGTSLANIAADYMPDIQYGLSGFGAELPLPENIAQPQRSNIEWFVQALGQDPEAYGTVIRAQEEYTAVALDYVINDVGGTDDEIVDAVENASEAGGQVAGILNQGRAEAVFDERIASDEEFNGHLDTGTQWAQRIAGVGTELMAEKLPVAGTITGWAAEDLINEVSEELRRDNSSEAAKDANDVYSAGEVRVEDTAEAAARMAAESNGNLDEQAIERIASAVRREARTGHNDGVEFRS
ncbi:hypothetical protein [Streptomyces sp. 6N223]|uniref:hypothetical protein n=1 Tax=Streptomyces sp. 6N223 TaxID=3457412 RepID=UPI003FD0A877